jgi:hypothetical protein
MIKKIYLLNSLKRLGLFSFLGLVLFATSCERPENDLGSELLPNEDGLTALQTDTLTLIATTVQEDSIRTDELSSVMLGSYIDPILGSTTASFNTQVRLSTTSPEFPDAPIIDSVVLALVYTGDFYGRLAKQQIFVHELTEDLENDSAYYTNTKHTYNTANEVKSGWDIYNFRPEDLVIVGTDSVVPQLRIHLKESLGQKLLGATEDQLSSNDNFLEFFKGLRVSPGFADACVANFDLIDSDSKLSVYYRYDNAGVEDTTFYNFNITSECSYYTQVTHNRTGTALAPLDSGVEVDGDVMTYIQAAGSMKTLLEFPYLSDFEAIENKSINRAELRIPFDDSYRFTAQTNMFLVYLDEEGDYNLLPDQVLGSIGGSANFTDDYYSFNISLYMQKVLNGEITSQGLYLISKNAGVSANRCALHGPNHTPGSPSENMRLILTFSY